jgi:hypothetical protein
MPYPQQNEGEKAPRENERSENAVSGRCNRTRNENKREKDSGHRPESTDPSERINKKDVSEKRDQQSGQRQIGCPQPFRIRQDACHFASPPLVITQTPMVPCPMFLEQAISPETLPGANS